MKSATHRMTAPCALLLWIILVAAPPASAQMWAGLGDGTNGQVRALAYDGLFVYVGGNFSEVDGGTAAENIAAFNPILSTWLPLAGGLNGIVNAIAIHPSTGDVYVGGSFTMADGSPATNIAYWTGAAWATLGSDPNEGINGEVIALAFNSTGDLFAGGTLGATNEVTPIADVNNIAMWDGSVWAALGTDEDSVGVDNSVNAIAIDASDNLYVGGTFVTVGNDQLEACRVAMWDGAAWHALGAGVDAAVKALAFGLTGDLYVGGEFDQAADALNGDNCALNVEGFDADNLAMWDGSNWSPLIDLLGLGDNGVGNDVNALLVEPLGNLIVGGQFTDAGACGSPCSDTDRIAIWQPLVGEWIPIDKGFGNNVVSALTFAPGVSLPKKGSTGKTAINVDILVAGGSFSMDGNGNSVDQVAQLQIELPVELTSFEAAVDGDDVLLTWTTASELFNSGFEIQHTTRQQGSEDWTAIGFVEGAGTTDKPQEYNFLVKDLAPGNHHFRLKQIDYDGAFQYGPVLEVATDVPGTHVLTDAYPNPFRQHTSVELALSREQVVFVELFDVSGRLLETLHEGPLSANVVHGFNIYGDELASGVYICRISGESFVESRQLVLLR